MCTSLGIANCSDHICMRSIVLTVVICSQVASTLDALGWEQATVGGSVTAEYWQFVPHGETLDIGGLTSQYGKDGSHTPISGLQTPPSAFERRRTSTQQLARAISQPSFADSPSPMSSIQLQRQSSAAPPYADAIHRTSTEQQRYLSRPQHRSPSSLPAQLHAMQRTSSDWQRQQSNSTWQPQQPNNSLLQQQQQAQQQQPSTTTPPQLRSSLFSASHRQEMTRLGSLTRSDSLRLQELAYTPASQASQPNAEPLVNDAEAAPFIQRSGLLSQPPSAFWTQNLPADGAIDQPLPLDISNLTISDRMQPAGMFSSTSSCISIASSHDC